MRTNTLGRTGLQVTELGYGTGQLRGSPRLWGGRVVDDAQADRILNAVLDAGINFIDTSNIYGRAEAFIGKHIGHRRDEFLIATKCGRDLVDKGDHDDPDIDGRRETLERTIDESLSRLKTDYVDLLQLHTPRAADINSDMIRALEDARQAGKTRFIGASVALPHLPAYFELGIFDAYQIPYSLLERDHEGWISRIAEAGCGTIIRGGVAQGAPEKGGKGADLWQRAQLDDLLDGQSRMAFILRFTLTHPDAHTTIVATINPHHLADNLKAVEMGALPPDVYAETKRRLEDAQSD